MSPNRRSKRDKAKNKQVEKAKPKDLPQPRVSLTATATYSGPLPPPQVLGYYDQCIPNGADRIMTMAEKQQEHRFGIEQKVVDKATEANERGQKFAFVIAVLAFAAIFFLAYIGMQVAVIAMTLVLGSGIIGIFITGRSEQKSTMAEKAKKMIDAKNKIDQASNK